MDIRPLESAAGAVVSGLYRRTVDAEKVLGRARGRPVSQANMVPFYGYRQAFHVVAVLMIQAWMGTDSSSPGI